MLRMSLRAMHPSIELLGRQIKPLSSSYYCSRRRKIFQSANNCLQPKTGVSIGQTKTQTEINSKALLKTFREFSYFIGISRFMFRRIYSDTQAYELPNVHKEGIPLRPFVSLPGIPFGQRTTGTTETAGWKIKPLHKQRPTILGQNQGHQGQRG